MNFNNAIETEFNFTLTPVITPSYSFPVIPCWVAGARIAYPVITLWGGKGDDIFGQYRKWRHNMAKKQYKFHKIVDAEKIARQNHMSHQLTCCARDYSGRFSI